VLTLLVSASLRKWQVRHVSVYTCQMLEASVLLFDGVADGPLGISLDVLGAAVRVSRAGLLEGMPRLQLRVRLLSIDGKPVRSAAGRVVSVDGAMLRRRWQRSHVVILPGLGMAEEQEITRALARSDLAQGARVVARAVASGALVAASCSATFVLGSAGVFDGREATTTWWLAPVFARMFPRAKLRQDRMVVADGNVVSAGSALAHADLMLALLTRLAGSTLAHTVARYLVLDERVSQARYMVREHLRSDDPVVQRLERFVRQNLSRQLSVDELARVSASSPRTLARKLQAALGTTPQRLVQRLRIERAVHLLETTRAPVDEIAALVGYADPAAFRRLLRRETGQSAREVRAGHAAQDNALA
jgi:transcriptional regulator GlxA family with amidase domain